MARRMFFSIAAILGALFGLMMFFAPSVAAGGFGFSDTPETEALFRAFGALIFSSGAMNFLVRNQPWSATLGAVLWTDVITHATSMIADGWALASGTLALQGAIPGQVTHVIVLVGALYFLWRGERTARASAHG